MNCTLNKCAVQMIGLSFHGKVHELCKPTNFRRNRVFYMFRVASNPQSMASLEAKIIIAAICARFDLALAWRPSERSQFAFDWCRRRCRPHPPY